uniref:Uncharacterized protein n=1 Tax=Oryza brachyantha TaxID=4533 RepID=J3KV48_ORYBR
MDSRGRQQWESDEERGERCSESASQGGIGSCRSTAMCGDRRRRMEDEVAGSGGKATRAQGAIIRLAVALLIKIGLSVCKQIGLHPPDGERGDKIRYINI